MTSIYDKTPTQLQEDFTNLGEKPFHARQVFEWVYARDVTDPDLMTNISKSLRAKLKEQYDFSLPEIREKQVSKDGTVKYLLELHDGGLIETVLMRHPYGLSLCVTSQLGCAMGCAFCASGLLKKERNLSSGEIVGQILRVQKDMGERISHVVVMGTGEPFDNYDNVLNMIYTINDAKGLAIGARHITVSTCGLVPMIERFSHEPIQVNLAISLHASNDETRSALMPVNKVYDLAALRDAMKDYIARTNRRVTLEYILIKDVNDDVRDARALAHYVRGLNVYVNLIPYNAVAEHGFQGASKAKIQAFKDELLRLKINATLRKEHGRDIDGACGQLRAKKKGVLPQ